jgi:hypothetical protein
MAEQLMAVRHQPVYFVGIVVNDFHFHSRPIALMNSLLKLWTALIKDEGSKYRETAPAAGAPAAAPEGFALACPSASPYLLVVGAGNPVAVLGLAQQGAKRAGIGIRAINSCRHGNKLSHQHDYPYGKISLFSASTHA